MGDVAPDLADKVLAADLRNHIKRVGDGGNLSPTDRQMFIGFASQGDLAQTRNSALLRKWLCGGRLSKDERDELADVLPNSRRVISDQYQSPPDGYGHLGIIRRTFFRWKAVGESAPGGVDLPPFDQPEQLEAWFERMRQHGLFKNRMPKAVRDAVSAMPQNKPAAKEAGSSGAANDGDVPSSFTRTHGVARGLAFEIDSEEHRVAGLRVAREEAYLRNERTEGDRLDRQYREALDQLSIVKQRALKTLELEGKLVDIEMVERELAPKLQTIVQGGMMFYDRIASRLEALPDHGARRRLWREEWVKHCKSLVEGRFAPPLNLEALT